MNTICSTLVCLQVMHGIGSPIIQTSDMLIYSNNEELIQCSRSKSNYNCKTYKDANGFIDN